MAAMQGNPVHIITDTLGADAICSALDVGPHSIRYARTTGTFPASWYGTLKSLCEAAGIHCPLSAFNWKGAKKLSEYNPDVHPSRARQATTGKPAYSDRGAE